MSEMVARVAKTLYEKIQRRSSPLYLPAWEKLPDDTRLVYEDIARAAVEAMREPTGAMLQAKFLPDESGHVPKHGVDWYLGDRSAGEVWLAMVSEALKQQ